MAKKKSGESASERMRAKIQEDLEREERNAQIRLFRTRIDIARAGVMFYQRGQYKEALEHYYRYLQIIERFKKVKSGQLKAGDFDPKSDVAEMLLLSGIFWDIAKLQDRSKKKDRVAIKDNLDKFVNFSKGMPYQHMCAELARKYLLNEKAVHRSMFKDAHLRLGGGKCFVVTAVEEYCEPSTLSSLRSYRDQVLLQQSVGRGFVWVYYRIGPSLARIVIRLPEPVQIGIAKVMDRIAQWTR